ncbi:MAG: Mitochondrial escape 2 [Lasallia pustulata]|uniref:Mitochondrial escape protein 2 n=1 Tax=Lasallia pustulata TaxID=136370 RepID=A0A5M8PTL8_9LECA|nr:MAG: Mitochondrial escape 2 [Lasallia pustulata]
MLLELSRSLARPPCPARLGFPRYQPFFTGNSFRPRQDVLKGVKGVRKESTEAGDAMSGHIHAGPNEGIFFLDNVFPLKLQWLLRIPFFNADKSLPELMKRMQNPLLSRTDPISLIRRAIPKQLPLTVTEVLPRLKEGGAFVKFSHEPHIGAEEIEGTLREYLKNKPIKPWFNPFRRVRPCLVQGRPWVEDLNRFPSTRVKVEFIPTNPGGEAAELSQETLYSLFRRYGKLADIVPQPTDSKVVPKFAYLNFIRLRQAIMAKNCMHGFTVLEAGGGGKTGTVLKLGYERKVKTHWTRDWLINHPRIVIPAVAALVATFTVAVFDPIRTFFIKAHVEGSFHLTNSRIFRWLKSQVTRANDILAFGRHKTEDAGLSAIWDDRKADIDQIQTWLMETAETFIVVQGPRGSGKKELVIDQALKDRKVKLVIDCKPIQEARGDSATIYAAAVEVGYRPVFSWMNSMSSLLDLAAQGTIGTKTGFSETLDTQLAKIWQNTTTALKQIALGDRKKDDKDADLDDDTYLEAHPEKRPVVVIDNFLHKSQESSVVYDKISEWAAGLTTANIAHVIFLTNDVSFSKSLSKALPDRVFRQIVLGDCSAEVAKRFVINHLDADYEDDGDGDKKLTPSQQRNDLGQLDGSIEILGGRLTDLEFLARRIKTGETPNKAVKEIIEQSASEILKMYILDVSTARAWTSTQAWLLIKSLATSDTLRYNELLLSDNFKSSASSAGGEQTLQALEQAELITIVSSNGRPHSIKPGKPVYQAAFKLLTEDHVLKSRLDLLILGELIKVETKSIDQYEAELNLLAGLPKQPAEVAPRVRWLLGKLVASQAKIEAFEKESGGLKKVLQKEY